MNILLTGSTGFLGGRLKKYLEKDHLVMCLPNDIFNIHPSAKDLKLDAVIHLVGLNDHQCQKDPLRAYDVNVVGTHNLLSSVNAKKIIYFSTIHSYGYPASGVITEETKPDPQSVYAVTHYLAERMVLRHLGGTVLRFSNGFGCPADPSRATAWIIVMNSICKQAVEKKAIELFVLENEERNFITVTDICGAVSHMLTSSECGIFNVGSTRSVRIVDMAYKVADRCQALFGYTPEINLANTGSWDFYTPRRSVPRGTPALDYRIDKLIKSGFIPRENYDEEIDNLLLVCKERRKNVSAGMPSL